MADSPVAAAVQVAAQEEVAAKVVAEWFAEEEAVLPDAMLKEGKAQPAVVVNAPKQLPAWNAAKLALGNVLHEPIR